MRKKYEIDELEEEEKKKKKKFLLLLLLLLLLLIIIFIKLWNPYHKPTAVLGEKEENNNTIENNVVVDDNMTNETTEENTATNNGNTSNISANNNSNNNVSNTTNSEETNSTPITQIEIAKEFKITSQGEKWEDNLSIFNNEKYDGKPVVYPGIGNTYYFELTNTLDTNVLCNLKFTEENIENLPIKYKLKEVSENGENYIKGNSNTYVSYNELNLEDIIVESMNYKVYALEWKWIDTENDNSYGDVGKNITYRLTIEVNTEEMIEN